MDGQSFDTTVYVLLAELYPSGKLPCLNDNRFLEGASTACTSKDAGLPNIKGEIVREFQGGKWDTASVYSGALFEKTSGTSRYKYTTGTPAESQYGVGFDASKSNAIYGKSNTVQPKSYTVKYYVCYA